MIPGEKMVLHPGQQPTLLLRMSGQNVLMTEIEKVSILKIMMMVKFTIYLGH